MNSSSSKFLLEIVIPTYRRPTQLLNCVDSVASQITNDLADLVGIAVWDDASDFFPLDKVKSIIGSSSAIHVRIGKNIRNKGMSQNIFDLFASSQAEYITVLSDDDLFHSHCLARLVDVLKLSVANPSEGALIFPRSCYSEGGTYLFSVCTPFKDSSLIKSSPLSALKYAHNGFILTGLILRRRCINLLAWQENIDNAFFPVIALSAILRNFDVRYISQDFFVHTVNNEVHWDRWGNTEQLRSFRLLVDYIRALEQITSLSLLKSCQNLDLQALIRIIYLCIRCMRKQYASHIGLPMHVVIPHVLSGRLWSPFRIIAYSLAIQAYWRSLLGSPAQKANSL